MNFMGLGFSFGAKDAGLKSKQKDVAQGFANIAAEVEKMGKRAEGGSAPVAKMTEEISGEKLDKLTMSIDKLAASLGKDLPTSAKRGAETMHRSAGNIESDERKIGGGLNFIRDAVEKLNSILRLNRLQTFIQSISLARLNDIANGVQSIAGEGMNLTTSLEGTIVAAHKSAKAAGTNFGLTGKALSRFTSKATSMGIALNMSTEEAAKATYRYSLAVQELGAVGIKSAEDLAKFSSVTGVSADMLVQTVRQARKQFGFTDDQLQQLTGSFVAAGQAMGDVGGMMQQMPQIMELISRRAAVLGKKLSPQQMADFAGQTAAASAAFYAMGASAEDAREMALSMATQMVESGETFSNMFAGTATDVSDFHLALGIATGDIDQAFKTMSQGPGEFMSGMAEMVLKSKKSGKFTAESMNMLRGQLEKVFGPKQAAMMVQFFSQADDAQLEQMKTMSKAKKDLGAMAREGYSSGRTLAESFDLMKDSFIMSFRAIGRSAARDFVKKTGQEFKKFNKQMNALVKKGGPMGKLIEKFSEMHQIGALALLPQTLRPMAAVFGTMLKEITPLIGVLGSLGFRLNMLASPFTILLAAAAFLGGWFLKLRMEGKSTGEAIKIMSTKIGEGAKKLWVVVKKWMKLLVDYLASVDWGAVFVRVFKALAYVMKEAGELLRQIPWGKIFKGVLRAVGKIFQFVASEEFRDALVSVFRWLGQAIVGLAGFLVEGFQHAFEALSEVDIGAVVSSIVLTLKQIFQEVGKAAAGVFEKLLDLFEYTASEGFRTRLMKIAEGVAVGIKAAFNALFDLLESALDYIGNIDMGKAVENVLMTALHFMEAWITMVVAAVETLAARLPSIIKKMFGLVIKALIEIPPAIGRFLSKAGDMLQRALPKLVVAILDTIWNILSAIPGLVMKALRAIPDIIMGLGKMLKGAIDLVVKAILGIFQGLEDWLVKKFPKAAGVIHAIFTALKFVVFAVGEAIKLAIDAIVAVFTFLYDAISVILKALWWVFDTFIIKPIKFAAEIIWTVLKAAWDATAAAIEFVWDNVLEPIFDAFAAVFGAIGDAAEWMWDNVLEPVFGAIGDAVGWLIDIIGGLIDAIGSVLSAIGDAVSAVGDFFGDVGGFFSDAASSVGGFFSDIGSGVSSFFGGGGSLTVALEATIKKQQEMKAAEEARKKAAAEAARLAVIQAEETLKQKKLQADHDSKMATEAARHKAEMEKLKFTYTEVAISASNAAAMSKKASDAAAKGIKDNIALVDKQARVANKLAMPKMDESMIKAIEEYDQLWNVEWRKSRGEQLDKVVAKLDALREQTMKTHGVTASWLSDMRKVQLAEFSMLDTNAEAQKGYIATLDASEQVRYKQMLKNMENMSVAEKKQYQGRLDVIFDRYLKERMEQQKIWRDAKDEYMRELGRIAKLEKEKLNLAGKTTFDMIQMKKKSGMSLSEWEIKEETRLQGELQKIEREFEEMRNKAKEKDAVEMAKIAQANLDAHNRAVTAKFIMESRLGQSIQDLEKDIIAGSIKSEEDRLAVIGAMHQQFAAKVADITKTVPESMQTAVESAQAQLNRAYFEQLNAITTNTALDAAAREQQLKSLEEWRTKNLDAFKEMTTKHANYVSAVGDSALGAMNEDFNKFTEGLTQKADEEATKASAAVGSIQRELGVSAEEALTNLKDIAAIDPKKFEQNLKVIKKVYIDFAKTAQDQTKLMLTETAKSFDEFNKVAIEHWEKQKGNLTLMMLNPEDIKKLSETVGKTVDLALASLTEMITTKVEGAVTSAFIKAFAKVIVETKKFVKDVMVEFRDLADQMVKKFGDTWAKILDFTLKALQAIEADTARAVANLKRIESAMRATAAAKAETAGGDVKQEVKQDTSKSELGNIFQATHHPEWYENDFKYKAMEIIAALNGLAAALSQAPRGGQGGATSGKTAAQIRRDAGLPAGSPGGNRGNGRANLKAS